MADKESGSESDKLNDAERENVARHEPLRAKGIHEIIRKEGESELDRDVGSLAWTGLAAGLSMGFSFATQALLLSAMPDTPWAHVIASAGYAIGFLIIVLGRQQLFTESTLTAALPAITNPTREALLNTLRLWAVVLIANIAGTWAFAAALAYGQPLRPETLPALAKLAAESVDGEFWGKLLRGVFAGWLIALMVWLLPAARSAKMFVIILLTWLVALARFPHIIAGSGEAAYAVLTGARPFGAYWGGFFAPTLIGNTLGGVLLVALLNHAPVAPELEEGEQG